MLVTSRNPRRAVPVLHTDSIEDPRALYEGGWGAPPPLSQARILHPYIQEGDDPLVGSTQWLSAEHQGGDLLRDNPGRKDAARTARRFVYGLCKEAAEVVLLRLTGAATAGRAVCPSFPIASWAPRHPSLTHPRKPGSSSVGSPGRMAHPSSKPKYAPL